MQRYGLESYNQKSKMINGRIDLVVANDGMPDDPHFLIEVDSRLHFALPNELRK